MHFFQSLDVGCTGPYAQMFFLIKKSAFSNCLQLFACCFFFSLAWDPHGSKNLKILLLQIAAESFLKPFLHFLLNGPHKITFGIFEMLTIFLALLDYVLRAHAIESLPASVVRLCHRLSLVLLHGFLSSNSCCFPWAIYPGGF